MSEQEIENEIQAKGLNALRIKPSDIDTAITKKAFYTFPGTTTTVALLTLKNGFTVTGESACASPENFDQELGNKIAFENARNKVWQLEGYRLKCELYRAKLFQDAQLELEQKLRDSPCPECNPNGVFKFGDDRCGLCHGKGYL
ncbi:Gp49 family protein [Methylomonas sp. AM2-LC]|uniref:Gp49 family protein n=1 Tax=Methylomonas sp. AM2-LC TaxID=3153301 RepID=UPI003267AFCA